MPESTQSLRNAALVAADVTALTFLIFVRPDLPALATDLQRPHSWVTQVGTDGAAAALAGAALWLCAAWLGIGLAIALLAAAPGWLGSLARRLAARLVPGVILRLAGTTIGISITLGTLGPGLAAAASIAAPSVAASASSSNAPSWPISTPAAPSWPVSAAPIEAPIPPVPQPLTPLPVAGHVVTPGESLWTIAASALSTASSSPTSAQPVTDQQIAIEVSAWYGANRNLIGSDPSLLRPGQHLLAPSPDPISRRTP
jgi:resuscitation-promoting factor RpfA